MGWVEDFARLSESTSRSLDSALAAMSEKQFQHILDKEQEEKRKKAEKLATESRLRKWLGVGKVALPIIGAVANTFIPGAGSILGGIGAGALGAVGGGIAGGAEELLKSTGSEGGPQINDVMGLSGRLNPINSETKLSSGDDDKSAATRIFNALGNAKDQIVKSDLGQAVKNVDIVSALKHTLPVIQGAIRGRALAENDETEGAHDTKWERILGEAADAAGKEVSDWSTLNEDTKFEHQLANRDYEGIFKGNNPKHMRIAQQKFEKEVMAERKEQQRREKAEIEAQRHKEKMKIMQANLGISKQKLGMSQAKYKKSLEQKMDDIYKWLPKSVAKERKSEAKGMGLSKQPDMFDEFMENPELFKKTHEFKSGNVFSPNGRWVPKTFHGGHYEVDKDGTPFWVEAKKK